MRLSEGSSDRVICDAFVPDAVSFGRYSKSHVVYSSTVSDIVVKAVLRTSCGGIANSIIRIPVVVLFLWGYFVKTNHRVNISCLGGNSFEIRRALCVV